jgi:hypothetical protein
MISEETLDVMRASGTENTGIVKYLVTTDHTRAMDLRRIVLYRNSSQSWR